MTGELALGPGAEFDAIRDLLARWGIRAEGIGDDAAVLQLPRGDALVASVDSAVEGRHFRRDWLTPREIGYRATAAALSDLAAMAAHPRGILIALVVPNEWRSDLGEIADGIGEAADVARTKILGGNMSGGAELSITTTVLGTAYTPLTRGGAQVGHGVYVTGKLGGVGAELEALLSGAAQTAHRDRFVHPVPRIREAVWLAENGVASAVDISDGLAADARHLATASGVCLSIDAATVPCRAGVNVAQALASGEEYELLVTSPKYLDVKEFESRFGVPLTRIGEVVAGASAVEFRGVRVADIRGYDHFSR
ncbi:MAG TPA: thiamine-phosphate kinase [Gemmatimonadaceae bacterium]|jgi:thiamine-monophosphate kinase